MSLPAFFSAIGTDHYLSPHEVAQATAPHPQLESAWRLYADRFEGFCGSRLDPDYRRHERPASYLGALSIDAGAPVLVVGTDPSLGRHVTMLRHVRAQLVLMTSPEGAEALATHGLTPDVVIVDDQPPGRKRPPFVGRAGRRGDGVLARCPLVAVAPRTPASLVADVPRERLFIPDPCPTWGRWPATAVALAAAAGARRIGLLGLDLGTSDVPDPRQRALAGLLSLLASTADAVCLDCGLEGARKAGWAVASLEEMTVGERPPRPIVTRRRRISVDEQVELDSERLRALDPHLDQARALLRLGLPPRAGMPGSGGGRANESAMLGMLGWGQSRTLRIAMQDTMGLSILPRLWRATLDIERAAGPWHPLLMAADEMVHQARKLEAQLERRLCARPSVIKVPPGVPIHSVGDPPLHGEHHA